MVRSCAVVGVQKFWAVRKGERATLNRTGAVRMAGSIEQSRTSHLRVTQISFR